MLKTVSSITNAIGALNYKGTWNASTNTPTITSSVGVKGDYYVVSVSGTTTINGISNWGVGDWITFNGLVWQRVEGGADLNGVNIDYTGDLTGGTGVVNFGSGQFQKDTAGNVGIGGDTTGVVAGVTVTSKFCVKNEGDGPVAGFVHVNNTTAGTGSGTFACRSRGTPASPAIVQNNDALWNMFVAGHDGTDLALAAKISVEVDGTPGSNDMPGRVVISTTPDGQQAPVERMSITSAGTIQLPNGSPGIKFGTRNNNLNDYEEGTWTPVVTRATTAGTWTPEAETQGHYIKIGNAVYITARVRGTHTGGSGTSIMTGWPFALNSSKETLFYGSLVADLDNVVSKPIRNATSTAAFFFASGSELDFRITGFYFI